MRRVITVFLVLIFIVFTAFYLSFKKRFLFEFNTSDGKKNVTYYFIPSKESFPLMGMLGTGGVYYVFDNNGTKSEGWITSKNSVDYVGDVRIKIIRENSCLPSAFKLSTFNF